MSLPLRAVYSRGAFVPDQPPDLPEGTAVRLTVERDALSTPPEVADSGERRRILKDLLAEMAANPIPAAAPRFSRDELHERR